MFGTFVKDKRVEADLTLREFCRRIGEDASNWSKIEREIMMPPKDHEKLARVAVVLGIETGSDEWNKLVDYATVDNGTIPDYIRSDKEVLNALPLFFRTVGSEKPTTEELYELIRNLREGK
jgi:transcriptional regulator with XRE-family HTH domain